MATRVNIALRGRSAAYSGQLPEGLIQESLSHGYDVALIDLDAIYEKGSNAKLIEQFVQHYPLVVGGGIKTVDGIRHWLECGAKAVILGTALVEDQSLNIRLMDQIADAGLQSKVTLSFDYLGPSITARGFKNVLLLDVVNVLKLLSKSYESAFSLQLTDANAMQYQTPIDFIKLFYFRSLYEGRLCYAGNVRTQRDIDKLNDCGIDAVLGRRFLNKGLLLEDKNAA